MLRGRTIEFQPDVRDHRSALTTPALYGIVVAEYLGAACVLAEDVRHPGFMWTVRVECGRCGLRIGHGHGDQLWLQPDGAVDCTSCARTEDVLYARVVRGWTLARTPIAHDTPRIPAGETLFAVVGT